MYRIVIYNYRDVSHQMTVRILSKDGIIKTYSKQYMRPNDHVISDDRDIKIEDGDRVVLFENRQEVLSKPAKKVLIDDTEAVPQIDFV